MSLKKLRGLFLFLRTIFRLLIKISYKTLFLYIIFFTLLLLTIQAIQPFILKHLLDKIVTDQSIHDLNYFGALLLCLLFLQSLVTYFKTRLFFQNRAIITVKLQAKILKSILFTDISYFTRNGAGYLVSRIHSDVDRFVVKMSDAVINLIHDLAFLVVGVVACFYLNPKLASICMVIIPAYVFIINYFYKKIRVLSKNERDTVAKTYQELFEIISGILLIKLLNGQRKALSHFTTYSIKEAKSGYLLENISNISNSIGLFIAGLGPVIIIWIGCREILLGQMSIGEFVAFNSFILYLIAPIKGLFELGIETQHLIIVGERLISIESLESEKNLNSSLPKISTPITHLSLTNVSFTYNEDKQILNNISIELKRNEVIGIVGYSGCGKSSLLSLIMGLYDNYSGAISINNRNIQAYSKNDLRKKVAYVQQENFLFSGSIKRNISLGSRYSSFKEIVRVAKIVKIHEFIQTLPDKYNTEVGERGCTLSGGQRQKLALARALLRKPEILLLDEATSQIDQETESVILKDLIERNEMIVLLISHRLSTIEFADYVYFMEKGQIKFRGRHSSLLSSHSEYKKIWNIFGG